MEFSPCFFHAFSMVFPCFQYQGSFEDYNESQYKLLIRKAIYPYEYMDDCDKFAETTLPPKEAFYSKLNMSGVSDQDYEHACRVWSDYGIRNLGEYHDFYLKTDVILLANVFKAFRKVCLDNYGSTRLTSMLPLG